MLRKVKTEKLKPGVFVHDFNSSWLDHPFLRNRVLLKRDADIEKILARGIREVYIDTERGLDIDDAPPKEYIDAAIDTEINRLRSAAPRSPRQSVPLLEEIRRAEQILQDSAAQSRVLLDAVKMGMKLDLPQVEIVVENMTASILRNEHALVGLARIKRKDEYTYLHSLAVSALCISFGVHLELEPEEIKALSVGGLLHDIGKVKMPLEVLNKPGPLTEHEFEIMKTHVGHGDCILRETMGVDESSMIVTRHHHERLDGSGYPNGLKGEEIGRFGRIGAIVDIYDAMTSERCYKGAIQPPAVIRKLYEWSDGYLDRSLVEQFILHMGIYPVGALVRLRSGIIGVVVEQNEQGLLDPTVRAVCDSKRGRLATPFEINLSSRPAGMRVDEIVGFEEPEAWNLSPEMLLKV